jgi:hypothetical protein
MRGTRQRPIHAGRMLVDGLLQPAEHNDEDGQIAQARTPDRHRRIAHKSSAPTRTGNEYRVILVLMPPGAAVHGSHEA